MVLHLYKMVSQFKKETLLKLKSVDSYQQFKEAHSEHIHTFGLTIRPTFYLVTVVNLSTKN